jgi:hypothetical protein
MLHVVRRSGAPALGSPRSRASLVRGRSAVIGAVSLCLLLSACGGGGDDPAGGAGSPETALETTAGAATAETDSGRSFEGVFAGSSRTTKSTVAGDPDVGKEFKRAFTLTCVDDDCAQLYLRSNVKPGRRGSGTWLFEQDGDELTAEDVRTGPSESAAGEYRQVLAWRWTVQEDGALRGALTQTFTGCKLDSTSTTVTTMAAEATAMPLPYASSADAEQIAAELTGYDAAFTQVNDGYADCDTASPEGRAPGGAWPAAGVAEGPLRSRRARVA